MTRNEININMTVKSDIVHTDIINFTTENYIKNLKIIKNFMVYTNKIWAKP